MSESSITTKGRTTVPENMRKRIQAGPGTKLVWSITADGTVIVRAKTKSIVDMAGMLKAPDGKRVAIDDMNPWR